MPLDSHLESTEELPSFFSDCRGLGQCYDQTLRAASVAHTERVNPVSTHTFVAFEHVSLWHFATIQNSNYFGRSSSEADKCCGRWS
jgi:hypothetical protein